jgi:probable F420-dependent oxidoreductase
MTVDVGRFGAFVHQAATPEQAREIETLGYGALWVAGSPPAELAFVEPILNATKRLVVATGVVNIWSAPAKSVAESFRRIDDAFPGRFLLGIGAGHREVDGPYRKPYDAVVDYLDELDVAGVPTERRVLAALGPRMLRLAAERTGGAHPALVTPKHTARARDALGPGKILAPHQLAMISTEGGDVLAVGRSMGSVYLSLSNYRNNWRRLGFTDADVAPPGSNRLYDALIAHGSAAQVAKRLNEHLDAGADHVAIDVQGGQERLLPTLTGLAGPLGLTPPG